MWRENFNSNLNQKRQMNKKKKKMQKYFLLRWYEQINIINFSMKYRDDK